MTDLVYASGIWQVQEGSIDEFGDRWKEFLGWTEGTLTGWSVEPPSRLRHQYGHQGAHDATLRRNIGGGDHGVGDCDYGVSLLPDVAPINMIAL